MGGVQHRIQILQRVGGVAGGQGGACMSECKRIGKHKVMRHPRQAIQGPEGSRLEPNTCPSREPDG